VISERNNSFALVTFSDAESLPRLPTTPFCSRKIAAAYARVYDFRESIHSPMMVDLDVYAVITNSDEETYRARTQMRVPHTRIVSIAFIEETAAREWMDPTEVLPELNKA
jgi:hypothetical protein